MIGEGKSQGRALKCTLDSQQLDVKPRDDEHMLLLSLKAQGTLGLIKDVRAGTCFLQDHN